MTSELDDYLARCQGVVWDAEDYLGSDALEWARHMLQHEPAEAMLATARAIVDSGIKVPADLIHRIRMLGTTVPAHVWPEDLDGFALASEP